jgi:hypothetical protein
LTRRTFFAGLFVAFAAGLGIRETEGFASTGGPETARQASAPTNVQPAAYSNLQIRFADAEQPTWNGAYLVFRNPPSPQQSLILAKNGQILTGSVDYQWITPAAIQLTVAYDPADSFIAWYRY